MKLAASQFAQLQQLQGQALRRELEKHLLSCDPAGELIFLHESNLLQVWLPEVAAFVGVEQPPQYHPEGDVWQHVLKMFRHFVWRDALTAWAILLHDVGKPRTQSRDPDGRIRFFGHEVVGAELADQILQRLEFAETERNAIVYAVRNHMRFGSVEAMKKAKLLKLITAPTFPIELELHRLDCLSSHCFMNCFDFLLNYLVQHPQERAGFKPSFRGRDLLALGLKPGPQFGKILAVITEREKCGQITSSAEATALARQLIAALPAEP